MHPIQGEDPLSHSGGKEVQATRGYDLADHPEMEQARRSALNTQHAGCAPCQAHHATQHGPAPGSKSSTPRKIGAKIIHHQMRCARQTDVGHRRIADRPKTPHSWWRPRRRRQHPIEHGRTEVDAGPSQRRPQPHG